MTTEATPHEAARPARVVHPTTEAARPAQVVVPTTNGSEKRKQRGVITRVLVYVVVAHLLAAYLYFLFDVAAKH